MSETNLDISKVIECLSKNCITEQLIQFIQQNIKSNLDVWNKISIIYDLRIRGKRTRLSKIDNAIEIIDQKGNTTDLVIIYSESSPLSITDLFRYLNLSKSLKVNIYLAIVDKYGDITYYNLSEVSLSKG